MYMYVTYLKCLLVDLMSHSNIYYLLFLFRDDVIRNTTGFARREIINLSLMFHSHMSICQVICNAYAGTRAFTCAKC